MTRVLLVKAHAHDNHRLLSYHDNSFCGTIITLSILLHITSAHSCVTVCACTTICVCVHVISIHFNVIEITILLGPEDCFYLPNTTLFRMFKFALVRMSCYLMQEWEQKPVRINVVINVNHKNWFN